MIETFTTGLRKIPFRIYSCLIKDSNFLVEKLAAMNSPICGNLIKPSFGTVWRIVQSGSVNKKGPFALPPEVEAMNIVELISMSGGFTDIARKNKVYVTRTFYEPNGNQEQKTFEVDVESLSRGSINNRNDKFWIYPEDQINVPERLF